MNISRHNKFPFYLLLAAAYPALTLYAANVKETNLFSVILAVGVMMAASLIVWILVGAMARNIWRAALPVSLAILFFFLYRYGQLVFKLNHTLYLPAYSVTALAAIGLSWWVDCRRSQVRKIANIALGCLIAAAIFQAAGSGLLFKTSQRSEESRSSSSAERQILLPGEIQKLPDIYCIILDSYADNRVLKQWFDFDNVKFIHELAVRGFNFPLVNASNYAATQNAIPALLKMGYSNGEKSVPEYLIKKGYNFWYSRSVYPLDKSAVLADRLLGKDYGTEFWHQLILQSMMGPAWKTFGGSYRTAVLNNFQHLEEAAKDPASKPLFVFAHIMIPHSPFVFKADGSTRYLLYTGLRKDIPKLRAAYVDQCLFANKKILATVDKIIRSERGRNAIIVLMGDHGPFFQLFSPNSKEGIDASWEAAMFHNLMAIRLPSGVAQKIPELTNVNVFRWIFHAVFDDTYDPVPNKFFRDYVKGGNPAEATDLLGPQLGFPLAKQS